MAFPAKTSRLLAIPEAECIRIFEEIRTDSYYVDDTPYIRSDRVIAMLIRPEVI